MTPTEDTADRDDLVARLLDHCAHMCVTGEEGPIADAVETRYAALGDPVTRVARSVVVDGRRDRSVVDGRRDRSVVDGRRDRSVVDGRRDRSVVDGRRGAGARPLVLLVGHLDVVPPTDDDVDPRIETRDGVEVVVARGASDMKAGNVAAMAAFEDAALRERSPYDLALVLYSGEEGGAQDNELRQVLAEVPWLRDAALAVVLEPTDGEVQLGCLGGLQAELRFVGRQAHSARPWHGDNALTKAGAFLAELHDDHVRDVEVDGIGYRDVWSATMAWSDGLEPGERSGRPFRNVVPGVFTVNLNLRFAPSRGLDEAEAELRHRVADRAEVTIVDRAPPAPPGLREPVVRAFVDTVAAPVAAKQAWTDVARFAEVGVPALNFGPGLTAQAHQRGEFVRVDDLVAGHAQLVRFLATEPS